MTTTDFIDLGLLGASFLTIFGGILGWAISKYSRVQSELEQARAKSVENSIALLNKSQEKTTERIERWEQTQNNQIQASMKQFMGLESTIKEYSSSLSILSIRMQDLARENENNYKRVSEEVDKLWKSFTKDIGEGWIRVSEKKK
jgi:predicted RNase H-like nuclease (RuvC/YqgF family)